MTKLNKLHQQIALIHMTALCCHMTDDQAPPVEEESKTEGEAATVEQIKSAQEILDNQDLPPDVSQQGSDPVADIEVDLSGEEETPEEVQGGELTIGDQTFVVSGEAITKAQAGDQSLARREISAQEETRVNQLVKKAGPDDFALTTIREAVLFLENVISYHMQVTNKAPGSFVKLRNDCQEFVQSNSSHLLVDRREVTKADDEQE